MSSLHQASLALNGVFVVIALFYFAGMFQPLAMTAVPLRCDTEPSLPQDEASNDLEKKLLQLVDLKDQLSQAKDDVEKLKQRIAEISSLDGEPIKSYGSVPGKETDKVTGHSYQYVI